MNVLNVGASNLDNLMEFVFDVNSSDEFISLTPENESERESDPGGLIGILDFLDLRIISQFFIFSHFSKFKFLDMKKNFICFICFTF